MPSWLFSMIAHAVALLLLAMISLSQPIADVIFLRGELATTAILLPRTTEFRTDSPDTLEPNLRATGSSILAVSAVQSDFAVEKPEVASLLWVEPEFTPKHGTQFGDPVMGLAKLSDSTLSFALDGRVTDKKQSLLMKYGGSDESEAAVARALHWLADHQARDGGWTFGHDTVCGGQCGNPGRLIAARNGATALALLPFLGAGETQIEGKYTKTVDRGLAFLLKSQQITGGKSPSGSWHEQGGTMYSHCLASIALCEAYAMTNDSRLRDPAQLALNYLVQTQHRRGGGWRYAPQEPGDTSVVGWAVMALKSGKIGDLSVPQLTLDRANRFLRSVSIRGGASYGYMDPGFKHDKGKATTSIGILCRMYQGLPKEDRGITRGIASVASAGPSVDNLYYGYYATQVMRHYGGPQWEPWNRLMRDSLVQSQVIDGHASGSWMPKPFPEMGGVPGGRLYSTCLATMILEVYYRHMPLYTDQAIDDDFEL